MILGIFGISGVIRIGFLDPEAPMLARFSSGGQTREHAVLVRSLGVNQLLVAVNKLDTVDWSQERFDFIVDKLKHFLKVR